MSRKPTKQRYILPDPKFNDEMVAKFINCLMMEGKKSLASAIFYNAVDEISIQTGEPGIEVWKRGLENVTPNLDVKRRKVGGSTVQVPEEVRPKRKITLSIRWIIQAARSRKEKTMKDRLVNEIIAASKGEGSAVKKKMDMHKTAESHKANSHIRLR